MTQEAVKRIHSNTIAAVNQNHMYLEGWEITEPKKITPGGYWEFTVRLRA